MALSPVQVVAAHTGGAEPAFIHLRTVLGIVAVIWDFHKAEVTLSLSVVVNHILSQVHIPVIVAVDHEVGHSVAVEPSVGGQHMQLRQLVLVLNLEFHFSEGRVSLCHWVPDPVEALEQLRGVVGIHGAAVLCLDALEVGLPISAHFEGQDELSGVWALDSVEQGVLVSVDLRDHFRGLSVQEGEVPLGNVHGPSVAL